MSHCLPAIPARSYIATIASARPWLSNACASPAKTSAAGLPWWAQMSNTSRSSGVETRLPPPRLLEVAEAALQRREVASSPQLFQEAALHGAQGQGPVAA
eukprot:3939888-Pyramimonas_sp.AAC.1